MLQLLLTGIKNSANINIENKLSSTLLKLILLSVLVIWTLGFLQPNLFLQNDSLTNYFFTKVYSKVCHQESSKCILIGIEHMLVCARCAGIYFGALIAALFTFFYCIPELRIKVFVIASLPLLLDVCLTFLGVYTYSQTVAFITGLAFGGIVYVFFLSELENFFSNKSIK